MGEVRRINDLDRCTVAASHTRDDVARRSRRIDGDEVEQHTFWCGRHRCERDAIEDGDRSVTQHRANFRVLLLAAGRARQRTSRDEYEIFQRERKAQAWPFPVPNSLLPNK